MDMMLWSRLRNYIKNIALGQGAVPIPGPTGKSAYELAVKNGFTGTEQQWLDTLPGEKGEGVPEGGAAGQVLRKKTNDDFDTEWADMTSAGAEYEHIQAAPSMAWNIQHNLGKMAVNCLCLDENGDQVEGQRDVAASTVNLLVIRHSEPMAGKAYIF